MPQRPTFKARDFGELINALPALYGFPPENSLVALGLNGRRITFGMRLDLPHASGIDDVADLAVRHLEHQRIEGAIILAVGEPLDVAQRIVSAVEARLDRVRPIAGGWADDERYWVSMDGGDPDGYPYRRSLSHPATAQAVWAGQEVSVSREAMAARVLPDAGERRAWAERIAAELACRVTADMASGGESGTDRWLEEEFATVVHDLLAGRSVDDGTLLRLGFAMTTIELRDAMWGLITPENAREMVRVWLHVGRLVPVAWTPAPLCLAAFSAWRSGDGAVAVMAAERALVVEPEYSMAGLMLALATSGISPFEAEGTAPSDATGWGDGRAAS